MGEASTYSLGAGRIAVVLVSAYGQRGTSAQGWGGEQWLEKRFWKGEAWLGAAGLSAKTSKTPRVTTSASSRAQTTVQDEGSGLPPGWGWRVPAAGCQEAPARPSCSAHSVTTLMK